MTALFGRKYKLTIDGVVEIDALDIGFKISKSITKHPNKAEIIVYNLSPDTRGKLEGQRDNLGKLSHPVAVDLEAGYDEKTSLIFAGDAHTVFTEKQGPDFLTHIVGGDGLAATRQARVSFSVKPGTGIKEVFKKLAKGGGWKSGNIDKLTNVQIQDMGSTFPDGTVIDGSAYDELERLAESAGYEVSIQDKVLQFKPKGQPVAETAIELNSDTGLIDSPTVEAQKDPGKKSKGEKFVKAKCLLIPGIFPGRKVNLSGDFKGTYECVVVEYNGELHGADWGCDLRLRPL